MQASRTYVRTYVPEDALVRPRPSFPLSLVTLSAPASPRPSRPVLRSTANLFWGYRWVGRTEMQEILRCSKCGKSGLCCERGNDYLCLKVYDL